MSGRPKRPFRPSRRLRDLAGQISNLTWDEMVWLRDKFSETLGDDEPEGGAGVREPRKTPPLSGSGSVILEIPDEERI